jgi:hypothetical protein
MRNPDGLSCSLMASDRWTLGSEEPVARLLTHELRTPLNAIIGFAELLLSGGSGPLAAEARTAVVEIARAARDLEPMMTAAGLLIELSLLPRRGGTEAVPLDIILKEAGFDLVSVESATGGAALAVEGTADRWAVVLSTLRSFLGRRGSQHAACLAAAQVTAEALCLRLWAEPGPADITDLGRVELSLAARVAAAEGAALTLGRRGDIRLTWPRRPASTERGV